MTVWNPALHTQEARLEILFSQNHDVGVKEMLMKNSLPSLLESRTSRQSFREAALSAREHSTSSHYLEVQGCDTEEGRESSKAQACEDISKAIAYFQALLQS